MGVSEEDLAAQLLRIVSEPTGRGCNILVAEAGEFYVQFRWHDSGVELVCEAVSNNYLEPEQQLDAAAVDTLRRFGFEAPGRVVVPAEALTAETAAAIQRGGPDESPNFFRYFVVDGPAAARRVAQTVFCVFHSVYHVPPQEPLGVSLIFGDGCTTEGYFTAGS